MYYVRLNDPTNFEQWSNGGNLQFSSEITDIISEEGVLILVTKTGITKLSHEPRGVEPDAPHER